VLLISDDINAHKVLKNTAAYISSAPQYPRILYILKGVAS